jgi:hypothetical protein
MTLIDIAFLVLFPSFVIFLIGLCIADHARRCDAMTEQERQEEYEGSII